MEDISKRMFTDIELNEYGKLFNGMNIDKNDQQTILEFFYVIGTMIYSSENK